MSIIILRFPQPFNLIPLPGEYSTLGFLRTECGEDSASLPLRKLSCPQGTPQAEFLKTDQLLEPASEKYNLRLQVISWSPRANLGTGIVSVDWCPDRDQEQHAIRRQSHNVDRYSVSLIPWFSSNKNQRWVVQAPALLSYFCAFGLDWIFYFNLKGLCIFSLDQGWKGHYCEEYRNLGWRH